MVNQTRQEIICSLLRLQFGWEFMPPCYKVYQKSTILTRLIHGNFNQLDYNLLRLAFQATIYHLYRGRNGRKHSQPANPTSQLVRTIDKVLQNRLASIKYHDKPRLGNILYHWFRAPQN